MSKNGRSPAETVLKAEMDSLDISWRTAWRTRRQYAALYRYTKRHQYRHIGSALLYVQGSARLGTVVRPVRRKDDHDLDTVLSMTFDDAAAVEQIEEQPWKLKKYAGEIVDDFVKVHRSWVKIDEGGRCWTLRYSLRKFHLDILPAVPDLRRRPNGLRITDRERKQLLYSDPVDYAEWFYMRMCVDWKSRMAVWFAKRGHINAKQKIPWWIWKTELQRVVQFLKRHRDIYFMGKPGHHKPPSIIVTTLAALAYENKGSLVDSLFHVVGQMCGYVSRGRETPYYIANPAQPGENFADRWCKTPQRAEDFYQWHKRLMSDLAQLVTADGRDQAQAVLRRALGTDGTDGANPDPPGKPAQPALPSSDNKPEPVTGFREETPPSGVEQPPAENSSNEDIAPPEGMQISSPEGVDWTPQPNGGDGDPSGRGSQLWSDFQPPRRHRNLTKLMLRLWSYILRLGKFFIATLSRARARHERPPVPDNGPQSVIGFQCILFLMSDDFYRVQRLWWGLHSLNFVVRIRWANDDEAERWSANLAEHPFAVIVMTLQGADNKLRVIRFIESTGEWRFIG